MRIVLSMLLLAVALQWGCHGIDRNGDGIVTVACLGDSNTQAGWPTPTTLRWCEKLRPLLPASWRTIDLAFGGMTACEFPYPGWPWGIPQVDAALLSGADVMVAAFGTNDVNVLRKGPTEIVTCLQALQLRAGAIPVMIATVPPDVLYPDEIPPLNAAIRAAISSYWIVDFDTGFEPYMEGVHVNDTGQDLRAVRARDALFR